MRGVLEALAEDLRVQGRLDVREAFIDGSFAPATRGPRIGKTKRGKELRSWPSQTVVVCRWLSPLKALHRTRSSWPNPPLVQTVIQEPPQNLIGDNAYDSDRLDTRLRSYGIELISPHRCNRKNKTQDLRRLRRYRRRWKIERLFAWLQNFRRLVVRYERHAENFLGMLYLGCCLILLRHL
jgi:transposase